MQRDEGEPCLLRQLDGIRKGGESLLRMILEGMENAEIVEERRGEYRGGRAFGQLTGLCQVRRGGFQLPRREVGMAQLRQDRRPPEGVWFVLRNGRGKFEELERRSGLAERFSRSGRGHQGLALLMGLALCFVLPCGFLP